jgi:hypothetical protein
MRLRRYYGSTSQNRILSGLAVCLLFCQPVLAEHFLVSDGRPKCAIVVQPSAGDLSRHAAAEIQRYIGELTGVRPDIGEPTAIAGLPKDQALILVGGPEANPLVKKAVAAGQIDFRGLKPEGFLLKTIELDGRPALVIGGSDEAGTLYGAYDWLERQGVVFQITDDIIPNYRDSLPLNHLDVRSAPSFSHRGFAIASCYETRSIWSYPDIVKFIDQMAKLKFNYLIWHMFSPEPYLEYSYAGEKKLMGDAESWEGGYTLPTFDFGSRKVEDYFVGKEAFAKFGKKYMAPDEWQGVKDQDRVFASARDLLQRVIKYAKTRNVKVWVALESLNELEPSMARYCRRSGPLPWEAFHNAYVCPTDPTVHKINEIRFKALLDAYPEAEGFIMCINEGYPVCHHPEDEALFEKERPKYAEAKARLIKTHTDAEFADADIENSIGAVHLIEKILEVRDRISPKTKLGIGAWGRAFLLPTLDKILPKDVLIVGNDTSGVWTPAGVPIQYYGGMGERDRIYMHVGDDDTGMVGMQFHVRLYYHDRLLEGSLENGVQGVAQIGDRFRGEEHLAKYMADGAWNPHLTPDQFYHDYARRIFGERAEGPMFQAFMALEDMEGYQGYASQKQTMMACCSPTVELFTARQYAVQPNPYDGPNFKANLQFRVYAGWKDFVAVIPRRVQLFTGERDLEEKALGYMKVVEAVAAPGSLKELHYLENKTQAYIQMIDTFIQLDQAFADFDQAFRLDPRTQREEFLKRLDGSLESFQKARVMARNSAQTWSEVVENVSDLGVLWRLNTDVVTGTDLIMQFMENIDNYHHGKPYLNCVEWEKVFSPLPIVLRGPRVWY